MEKYDEDKKFHIENAPTHLKKYKSVGENHEILLKDWCSVIEGCGGQLTLIF